MNQLLHRAAADKHAQQASQNTKAPRTAATAADFSAQVYWYELPIKVSPWVSQQQYDEERRSLRSLQDTHGYHVSLTPAEYLPSVLRQSQRTKRYYDQQRGAFRRGVRVDVGLTTLGVLNMLMAHLGRDLVSVTEAKRAVDAVIERYRAAEAAFRPTWEAYHARRAIDPTVPPPVEPQFLPDAPLLLVLQPLLAVRGLTYDLRPGRGKGSYDLLPSDLARGERVALAVDVEKPAMAGLFVEKCRRSKNPAEVRLAMFVSGSSATDDRPFWRVVKAVRTLSKHETVVAFIHAAGVGGPLGLLRRSSRAASTSSRLSSSAVSSSSESDVDEVALTRSRAAWEQHRSSLVAILTGLRHHNRDEPSRRRGQYDAEGVVWCPYVVNELPARNGHLTVKWRCLPTNGGGSAGAVSSKRPREDEEQRGDAGNVAALSSSSSTVDDIPTTDKDDIRSTRTRCSFHRHARHAMLAGDLDEVDLCAGCPVRANATLTAKRLNHHRGLPPPVDAQQAVAEWLNATCRTLRSFNNATAATQSTAEAAASGQTRVPVSSRTVETAMLTYGVHVGHTLRGGLQPHFPTLESGFINPLDATPEINSVQKRRARSRVSWQVRLLQPCHRHKLQHNLADAVEEWWFGDEAVVPRPSGGQAAAGAPPTPRTATTTDNNNNNKRSNPNAGRTDVIGYCPVAVPKT